MASISHLLNRSVTVKRQSLASDGQGGFSNTLTPQTPVLKGRRRPASGGERSVAGREEAQVTHVWYFEPGVDVRVRDVFVSNGVEDEVVALLPPSEPDHLKVQVKEFQVGATQ